MTHGPAPAATGDPSPSTGGPPAPLAQRLWRAARSALISMALFVTVFAVVGALGAPVPAGTPARLPALGVDGDALRADGAAPKRTLVYVWATWCTACKVTTPTVDGFARRRPDVPVIAIAADEPEAVRAALVATPRAFRVAIDDGSFMSSLGIRSLPTTLVVDAAGTVLWSRAGVLLPGELDVRLW